MGFDSLDGSSVCCMRYVTSAYLFTKATHFLGLSAFSSSFHLFSNFFVTFVMHFHQLNTYMPILARTHIQIRSYEKYAPCVFFTAEREGERADFIIIENVFNILFIFFLCFESFLTFLVLTIVVVAVSNGPYF